MFPSQLGKDLRYVLLASLVLAWGQPSGGREQSQVGSGRKEKDNSPDAKKQNQDFEKLIYDMLAEHHFFNHPQCRWIVQVKRFQGPKLQFLQIIHRDATGRGYDRVGKALEAELRVDL